MSFEDIKANTKILIYLDNGEIVGGTVTGKTPTAVKVNDAHKVREEWVSGMDRMYVGKTTALGNIDINADTIIRWRTALPGEL